MSQLLDLTWCSICCYEAWAAGCFSFGGWWIFGDGRCICFGIVGLGFDIIWSFCVGRSADLVRFTFAVDWGCFGSFEMR